MAVEEPSLQIDQCPLCSIFTDEQWLPFWKMFSKEEHSSELLFSTECFGLVADIGAFVDGYCLLITRDHYPSMASLSGDDLLEFSSLKSQVKSTLSRVYGDVIIFEHGAKDFSHNAGCCVEHAHIHFVPTTVDLLEDISKTFQFRQIDDFSEAKHLIGSNGYLYYENQVGQQFVTNLEVRLPSQYLRKVLAAKIGLGSSWNWRDYVRDYMLSSTKTRIDRTRKMIAADLLRNPTSRSV